MDSCVLEAEYIKADNFVCGREMTHMGALSDFHVRQACSCVCIEAGGAYMARAARTGAPLGGRPRSGRPSPGWP